MSEYFVATNGSSANPGTKASPWNLQHAFSGAAGVIQPGDAVWMRGGTYTKPDTWVCITSGSLIQVAPGLPFLRLVNVTTQTELNNAISAALPGDKIVIASGTYAGGFNLSRDGTTINPIIITSSIPGNVTLKSQAVCSANNVIITGLVFEGPSGVVNQVVLSDCHDVVFTRNEIRGNVYNAGLSLTHVYNTTVTYNYIHDNGLDSNDHGIYFSTTIGPGNVIANNLIIHNHSRGISIHSNGGQGVYDVLIANNTIVSNGYVGILLTDGDRRTVVNNILAFNGDVGGTKQMEMYTRTGAPQHGTGIPAVDDKVWNNLTYSPVANRAGISNTVDAAFEVGNIIADPLFVDLAVKNWHLTASSPAINMGRTGYVTDDYDGRLRDATPDAGAYEFGTALATPGVSEIKWRNFPGEKVSITTTNPNDTTLEIRGSFNWLYGSVGQSEGIEIWRNVSDRVTTRGDALWFRNEFIQNGNKAIHIVVRDGANGIFNGSNNGNNFKNGDLEIYGCLNYNNGDDTVGTAPTSGMLLRHEQYLSGTTSELLSLTGNIIFNTLGDGIQLYAGVPVGRRMIGVRCNQNIAFGAGVLNAPGAGIAFNFLLGGGGANSPIEDFESNNNISFHNSNTSDMGSVHLGSTGVVNSGAVFNTNYIVGGSDLTGQVKIADFSGIGLQFTGNVIAPRLGSRVVEIIQLGNHSSKFTWDNNTWYRDPATTEWRNGGVNRNFTNWKSNTGLGNTDTAIATNPTANKVFVIPLTKYTPKYGHVCFFNWASGTTVPVDLSTILSVNDDYKVFNAQDRFGAPILTGVYNGGSINFPTTGVTPPSPIGTTPALAVKTAPFFDAFIVVGSVSLVGLIIGTSATDSESQVVADLTVTHPLGEQEVLGAQISIISNISADLTRIAGAGPPDSPSVEGRKGGFTRYIGIPRRVFKQHGNN